MRQESPSERRFVISYMFLRKAIGVLGVALPFALALGGLFIFERGVQDSISHYYHTGMGDVFVGTLCAIAVFLLSYKGHEDKDDRAGDFACLCAVGTALFPTTPLGEVTQAQTIVGGFHFAFAALFFLTLAYFSLVLFTKTDPTRVPTPRKLQRNRVYRICGGLILLALVLIALYKNVPGAERALGGLQPVFWLEAVAVVAFGLSWLTKGEAILEDKVPSS